MVLLGLIKRLRSSLQCYSFLWPDRAALVSALWWNNSVFDCLDSTEIKWGLTWSQTAKQVKFISALLSPKLVVSYSKPSPAARSPLQEEPLLRGAAPLCILGPSFYCIPGLPSLVLNVAWSWSTLWRKAIQLNGYTNLWINDKSHKGVFTLKEKEACCFIMAYSWVLGPMEGFQVTESIKGYQIFCLA